MHLALRISRTVTIEWTDAYLAAFAAHVGATIFTLDRAFSVLGKAALKSPLLRTFRVVAHFGAGLCFLSSDGERPVWSLQIDVARPPISGDRKLMFGGCAESV